MSAMPLDPQQAAQNAQGLAAQLVQLAPMVKSVMDRIKPVLDQPIIRFPYMLPLANSFVVGAGVRGARMPDTDFGNSLEWPFEVHYVKFSQDPAHTARDWRVSLKDQTFNQDWMKSSAMVAQIIDNLTGQWELGFPWVVRPKGGGVGVTIDNLDAVNPITVDINFVGYLMIPRV
jgi:hypothetical protein